MNNMKYYVITFYNIDTTERNDINICNGGVYTPKLFRTLEEAEKERKKLIDAYIEEAISEDGWYSKDEGWTYVKNEYHRHNESANIYIDWIDEEGLYACSEVIQIEEVEVNE